MQICSNCGKPVAAGRTTCRACGGAGIAFDDGDDKLTSTLRKPVVQAVMMVLIAVLAFVLVRSVVAHRAVAAEAGPSPEISATPTKEPKPSPNASVTLPSSPNPSSVPEDDSGMSGMIPPLPFVGPDPSQLVPLNPGDPATAPMIEPDVTMPADVRSWLDHLASIEAERQNLASQQLAAASALAGNAVNSPDGGAQDYANAGIYVRAAWADLNQRFNDEPAPPECASVRAIYNSTLSGTRALMTDLMTALRSAARSPERAVVLLTRIRDEATQRVDQPAQSADEALDDVCGRYQVDKWFDIDNRVADRMISQLGL